LLYGAVRLDAFAPPRLADGDIRALIARTTLHDDPALSARFPGKRAARVRVALTDGRTLEHFAPYRKGDPEAPLSDADINDKFAELATPVIGPAAARSLLDRLWSVERIDVRALGLAALPGTHPRD
jgi:2-methylcitrate dehydratase PrpD